jgi:hypothetical protein
VAAIIAMGRSLKLRIVAEGVETQGQMTRLFDQGCHLMQGFLFSPAVPGEDFPALVRAAGNYSHWRPVPGRAEGSQSDAGVSPASLHSSLKRGPVWPAAPVVAERPPEHVRARSS